MPPGAPARPAAPEHRAPTATGSSRALNGSSGSSSSTSTTAAYRDGTYTGDTITTRYGDVQVKVTVSGGAITDVAALSLPDRDGHSSRISSQAGPILRDEALTAQSAQIDLLSGATYTSDGYERSLQSALDQAAA